MLKNWKQATFAAVIASGALLAQPALAPPPPEPPPAPLTLAPLMWSAQGSYLGVGLADVDAERAKALNLKETRGVELTSVSEDSPAAKAGLKSGDVVLEFNGQRLEGMEQFMRLVRETPPGREVKVLYSRAGATQTAMVTTGRRKSPMMYGSGRVEPGMRIEVPRMEFTMPDMPRAMMSWRSGMLGIEAEELNGQLGEFFGAKEGVLVRSVGKGTAAEKAGLKAGDVIIKVDGGAVSSPRAITQAVRGLREKEKKTFPVTVLREKKETILNVTLDEPATQGATPRPRARVVNREQDE